jgi:hypothetical protein
VNNVIAFPRFRWGERIGPVPLGQVPAEARRILARQREELIHCRLEFGLKDQVTIINGWAEDEPLAMPFCSGELDNLEYYLGLYQEAVALGIEPNPCLAAFHRAIEAGGPYWSFSSPEAVKFPLGG